MMRLDVPRHAEYSALSRPSGRGHLALAMVGQLTFSLEDLLSSEPVSSLSVMLPCLKGDTLDLDEVARQVEELVELILLRRIDLSLGRRDLDARDGESRVEVPTMCLFSGGVDSLCGAVRVSREGLRANAIFCSHVDQSKIRGIVGHLGERFLAPMGMTIETVRVPKIRSGQFRQTRGALYILVGLAFSAAAGAGRLVVSEVGPTMYQPRMGPMDEVTMTTHPYVIEFCEKVASLVLGSAPSIDIPFEDMTKAEVMARYDPGLALLHSHSCISQRFGTHDGTCYGCVMRRLAARTAGTLDVEYDRDPITDDGAAADNLAAMLSFSLIVASDINALPGFASENLDLFKKRDLFTRFAMDNLAALYDLHANGTRLSPVAERFRLRSLEALGEPALRSRILEVRALKSSPSPMLGG